MSERKTFFSLSLGHPLYLLPFRHTEESQIPDGVMDEKKNSWSQQQQLEVCVLESTLDAVRLLLEKQKKL